MNFVESPKCPGATRIRRNTMGLMTSSGFQPPSKPLRRALVIGASGQLGQALVLELKNRGVEVAAWSRPEMNYEDLTSIQIRLDQHVKEWGAFDAIFNAAAYTQVDLAETHTVSARTVNAELPRLLAEFARQTHAVLIHYSTDYVYSGEGSAPFVETDAPAPLSQYGKTKLEGDLAVAETAPRHLIFRTSWVFAPSGKNFVLTMLKLGAERTELKVVADQMGAPTYAPDLARHSVEAVIHALDRKLDRQLDRPSESFPSGIYHLTNSGETSWHGFAEAIFEKARALSPTLNATLKVKKVEAIPTTSYPTPARRPLNSRLNLSKFKTQFGIEPRHWRDALDECLRQIDLVK